MRDLKKKPVEAGFAPHTGLQAAAEPHHVLRVGPHATTLGGVVYAGTQPALHETQGQGLRRIGHG